MCLGIPGRIIEISDPDRCLAVVEVGGVRRPINISFIAADASPGESLVGLWVLVHVGFAMSRIDEEEAARSLALLHDLGEAQAEIEVIRHSVA